MLKNKYNFEIKLNFRFYICYSFEYNVRMSMPSLRVIASVVSNCYEPSYTINNIVFYKSRNLGCEVSFF